MRLGFIKLNLKLKLCNFGDFVSIKNWKISIQTGHPNLYIEDKEMYAYVKFFHTNKYILCHWVF